MSQVPNFVELLQNGNWGRQTDPWVDDAELNLNLALQEHNKIKLLQLVRKLL